MGEPELGTFCLVLHSHLPWVAQHGRWPVGEEWLYQAWARCYLPLVRTLRGLADRGERDLLTLGVTPVLADQLDDPYCLRGVGEWVADWSLRAQHLAADRRDGARALASAEFRQAQFAAQDLEGRWRSGASPVLADLARQGVVELLGGPVTHPFLPLLDPVVARWSLVLGRDDARWRGVGFSFAAQGIWAPECGSAPGLEALFESVGVSHLVLDEVTVAAGGRDTSTGWRMGDSSVVAVGRDLAVTDRIWSSRTGYPTAAAYRDFHAVDADTGFSLRAVTSPSVGASEKGWYDSASAGAQVSRDVADFVTVVRDRLREVAAVRGTPGLVVAAYDTELFGHWWHEGPAFLARVLPALRQAGVRVTTLAKAVHGDDDHEALVGGSMAVRPGSWGAGKDYSVWAGEPVKPLLEEAFSVQRRLVETLRRELTADSLARRPELDQLVRQAMLALSSDWAFMVTRESAVDYAVQREAGHREAFHRLADLIDSGPSRRSDALAEANAQQAVDGPFGWLDARALHVS